MHRPFHDLLRDQSTGGVLLFVVAVIAMVWANSPWKESHHHLWEHTMAISFDAWKVERTLNHWIILVASVLAGTIGFLLLRRSPPVAEGVEAE